MEKFDEIDIIILGELTQESNISIPKLSEKISINSSVVYSRINRLVRKGFIKKYTLEVDENLLGYPVKAMIGCNISSKQRETILEDITANLNADPRLSTEDIRVSEADHGIAIQATIKYVPLDITEKLQFQFDENSLQRLS